MSEANLNGSSTITSTITDEAIAQRAYEIWESRGCPEGDGGDDWQTAYDQLQSESDEPMCSNEQRRGPLLRWWDRIRSRAA